MKPLLHVSVCPVIMLITVFAGASTLHSDGTDHFTHESYGVAAEGMMLTDNEHGFSGINVKTLKMVSQKIYL